VLTRAHKVLIDTKAGNGSGGNMLYLPLDKLLEKTARDDNAVATVSPGRDDGSSAQKQEPDSVTVEARGRGDR
jgi:5-deoxy-D-glucuronate isomerase